MRSRNLVPIAFALTAVAGACVQPAPDGPRPLAPERDASDLDDLPDWHFPPPRPLPTPAVAVDGADGGARTDGVAVSVARRPVQGDGCALLDDRPRRRSWGEVGGGSLDDDPHGDDAPCADPLGPGDLAIVELMIKTTPAGDGTPDVGEWFELQSTRLCTLDLSGLRIESPRRDGGLDVVSVEEDLLLAPFRTVIVADAAYAKRNHGLRGPVIAFPGEPADVLDDGGDTITLFAGSQVVDRVTYPRFDLEPGRSIAFPSDCAWTARASWPRWSFSYHSWSPTFVGTPNGDNTDVACY